MSPKPSNVRRIGASLVLASVALVSSACAAGQHAATAEERPTLDGVNGDIGKIGLRGVAIVAPSGSPAYKAGADVVLTMVIVNDGQTADSLVDVKTSAAKSWAAFTSASDAQSVIDAHALAAPSSSPSAGSQSVQLPPGVGTGFGTPTAKGALLLEGLTKQLYPADAVSITFTFHNAGSVTLQVPVQQTTNPSAETVAPVSTGAGA